MSVPAPATLRLDLWLFHARFCRTRSQAVAFCQNGQVRIDGQITYKAHHRLRVGTVLTFPQGAFIRIVRVLELASQRQPPQRASALYEDLAPLAQQKPITRSAASPCR